MNDITHNNTENLNDWSTDNSADKRTDLALQRTLLAHERTFSAWVRTGIAALAAGLGIFHLLKSVKFPWAPQVIGIIFVLAGGGIFLVAIWRYYHGYQSLKSQGLKLTNVWLLLGLIISLLATVLLAFVILFE